MFEMGLLEWAQVLNRKHHALPGPEMKSFNPRSPSADVRGRSQSVLDFYQRNVEHTDVICGIAQSSVCHRKDAEEPSRIMTRLAGCLRCLVPRVSNEGTLKWSSSSLRTEGPGGGGEGVTSRWPEE